MIRDNHIITQYSLHADKQEYGTENKFKGYYAFHISINTKKYILVFNF